MSEQNDQLFDLLVTKAIYGLDEAEQAMLDEIDPGNADVEFRGLEIAAASIGLAELELEPMPAHLNARIAAGSAEHFSTAQTLTQETGTRAAIGREEQDSVGSSWFGWLGWAVAAAACVVLALNLWFTRVQPEPERAQVQPIPRETPAPQSTPAPAQARDILAATASDMIRATWAAGNVKGISDIVGDIIWSDEKQSGYMTFKGLPPNDPNKETYQLWIMDENQGDTTPIDGGTFDVGSDGEVVVPINARLKAKAPHLFAVTIEKPGGVVVSKREKIAAVAKVETRSKPTT